MASPRGEASNWGGENDMDLEGQEGSCSCFESGWLGEIWYHDFSREVRCGSSALGERVRSCLTCGFVVMEEAPKGERSTRSCQCEAGGALRGKD